MVLNEGRSDGSCAVQRMMRLLMLIGAKVIRLSSYPTALRHLGHLTNKPHGR